MDFNDLIVRLINVIQKRRILFYLLFLSIFVGAVGGAYVKPARFESTATLMVTLDSNRVKTTASDQQQLSVSLQPEEIMAAQVEIMRAREVKGITGRFGFSCNWAVTPNSEPYM